MLFSRDKAVVGMLHAPPLPGSPRYRGDWQGLIDLVLRDAAALTEGGVDGLMLENFGDAPFFPGRVPAHVVASMTALAVSVRARFDVPLGINLLRNDGLGALAIACAVGGCFIRVNVLCGARVTDQGVISGNAHELLRERMQLGSQIKILADIDVKHSAPLAARPLTEEVDETLNRGGADALVVTGRATGGTVVLDELREVRAAAGQSPVWIGSGVSPDTISQMLPHADGFIVGTALKVDGRVGNPVDANRVKRLMRQLS